LLLAALPLVLGAHLLIESLIWWQLRGEIPHEVGRAAAWLYLLIALVVVPVLVPVAVMMLEPTRRRRLTIAPFVLLGGAVAGVLLVTMLRSQVTVRLGSYHLGYGIGLHYGVLVVGFYVLATCGSLLMSGYRDIVIFGLANVVAVIVLARLTADGFTSLWSSMRPLRAAPFACICVMESRIEHIRMRSNTDAADVSRDQWNPDCQYLSKCVERLGIRYSWDEGG
jgi:hypothetical protein